MTNEIVLRDNWGLDAVVQAALGTVSPSSARVYNTTYRQWASWCRQNARPALPVVPAQVSEFLASLPTSKTGLRNHLAALRKLAWVLSLDTDQPMFAAYYEYLRKMRVPATEVPVQERDKSTLSAAQVERVLNYWNGSSNKHLRNRVILRMALATGGRRSEVVALRWSDIHLDDGTVNFRHAKGDKFLTTAIVEDFLFEPLSRWREQVPDYEFVFVPVLKNDKIGPDKPIRGDAFYKIVEQTGAQLDISISPHKLRRTLGTELDRQGVSISDIQAQLNHADPGTTLKHYIKPGQARTRRHRLKTSWHPDSDENA